MFHSKRLAGVGGQSERGGGVSGRFPTAGTTVGLFLTTFGHWSQVLHIKPSLTPGAGEYGRCHTAEGEGPSQETSLGAKGWGGGGGPHKML